MNDLDPIQSRRFFNAALRRSPLLFGQRALIGVSNEERIGPQWVHQALACKLGELEKGNDLRLIVDIVDGFHAEFMCGVVIPLRLLARNPQSKIIVIRNPGDDGDSILDQIERIARADWFQSAYPELKFHGRSEGEMRTRSNGIIRVISPGGALPNWRADHISVLEITEFKPPFSSSAEQEPSSEAAWCIEKAFPKINTEPQGSILVCHRRAAVDDIVWQLITSDEGHWEYLRIPVVAIHTDRYPIGNRYGGEWHERSEDEYIAGSSYNDDGGSISSLIRSIVFPQ